MRFKVTRIVRMTGSFEIDVASPDEAVEAYARLRKSWSQFDSNVVRDEHESWEIEPVGHDERALGAEEERQRGQQKAAARG